MNSEWATGKELGEQLRECATGKELGEHLMSALQARGYVMGTLQARS